MIGEGFGSGFDGFVVFGVFSRGVLLGFGGGGGGGGRCKLFDGRLTFGLFPLSPYRLPFRYDPL